MRKGVKMQNRAEWKGHSADDCPNKLREWCREASISRFQLRQRMVKMKGFPVPPYEQRVSHVTFNAMWYAAYPPSRITAWKFVVALQPFIPSHPLTPRDIFPVIYDIDAGDKQKPDNIQPLDTLVRPKTISLLKRLTPVSEEDFAARMELARQMTRERRNKKTKPWAQKHQSPTKP